MTGCSDLFFSAPGNLLMPHPPVNMGDGWETRRRCGPGHDRCVIRLGRRGVISALEVDTTFFQGNHPARVSLERGDQPSSNRGDELVFETLLSEAPLRPDRAHRFDLDPNRASPCTHLRLNIHPDGGIIRFRAYGRPCAADRPDPHDA